MTDRDTFAAAALAGLLARGLLQTNLLAADAYKVADAMLRERCRRDGDCPGSDNAANHDAAPEAIAPEPEPEAARRRPAGGTGKTNHDAAPAVRAGTPGTGDTPRPISGCVSDRPKPIASEHEPVAWGVASHFRVLATSISRMDAVDMQSDYAYHTEIVPLYRHPPYQVFLQKNLTLTDAEREAVCRASQYLSQNDVFEGMAEDAATLRGLLERTK